MRIPCFRKGCRWVFEDAATVCKELGRFFFEASRFLAAWGGATCLILCPEVPKLAVFWPGREDMLTIGKRLLYKRSNRDRIYQDQGLL